MRGSDHRNITQPYVPSSPPPPPLGDKNDRFPTSIGIKLRSKDLKRLGFDFRGELSFISFSNGPNNNNNISHQYFSELLLTKSKKLVKKGDVIKNVQYAETLETVRDDPDSFYNGTLARDILSDIRKVNGNVTEEDLRKSKTSKCDLSFAGTE